MFKFLIFLAFFVSFSSFLIDGFALEVEIQKESERIQDSMGWLEPQKVSLQEQIQIIIDHSESKNKITVGLLSKDLNDIRFPDYIENLRYNEKIISFMITNQFGCAPTQIDRACIIIDVERDGMGDTIEDIRNNTREVTDEIVKNGIIHFTPEFYSVAVKPKNTFDGEKIFVSRALYTINKQPTTAMFGALAPTLVSSEIRTSGGFYDQMEKLTENTFSDFAISFVPLISEDSALRSIHTSVICSDKIIELIRCPENITEQIANGEISPLDFLQTESVDRSKIFGDEFLPLNSIIQVTIFSEESLEIKSVNTNLIEKLMDISDVQNNGWIFSELNKRIDGRYIFAQDHSVSKSDLIFTIGPNTDSPIEIKETNNGGGCLIATAAFGSEMAPQVQFLREIRDNTVLQTTSGSTFMMGFNQLYYSFSPTIADYARENPIFKESVKLTLTPLLASLTLLQYPDIDSEFEMLGYGIGVILLNIVMYFVIPAALIMKIKKRI